MKFSTTCGELIKWSPCHQQELLETANDLDEEEQDKAGSPDPNKLHLQLPTYSHDP